MLTTQSLIGPCQHTYLLVQLVPVPGSLNVFFLLQDENCTMFLIAGYSRYNCPYVWVSLQCISISYQGAGWGGGGGGGG